MHICKIFCNFAAEMKRISLFLIGIALCSGAWGQLKLPQIRGLESKGWSIQHSVMSWDSLSIYFAAKEPQGVSYDLYMVTAEGWLWSQPKKLSSISTREDESWPTISSDARMLFYIQHDRIVRAWYRDGRWEEAAPIIISEEGDLRPQLMEDNKTLVFWRREESKRNDGAYSKWYSVMMDDHNWTNPVPMVDGMQPSPILAANGTLVKAKGRAALGTGEVLVYDATNEQLLQRATVHPRTGRWRVALQQNRHYRLALTAPGYSYHYIDIRTDGLSARKEQDYGEVALDDELSLTLQTYDSETQAILNKEKRVLPLGQIHRLGLSQNGYHDTTLVVNTLRPTVFTETELDIAMRAKKSRHRFIVVDKMTGSALMDANVRMDGRPTAKDTLLRLNEEHSLQVSAKGYVFDDTLFTTGNTTSQHVVVMRLVPLTKDLVLQLRNIQFEHDSYELTESSNEELEALAQLLFMNPTLRIELSSHTDDQGSDKYNDRLSTMRGKAVEKWLLDRGVDGERMVIVGYGKRKPLVANDSDENRAINRRVEIKVLEF